MKSSASKQHIENALIDLDIHSLSDADITLDKINRDWSIYQLKKGIDTVLMICLLHGWRIAWLVMLMYKPTLVLVLDPVD